MSGKRWAQVITVAMVSLEAVVAATHLFPEDVRAWSMFAIGLVGAVASALGFNTGSPPDTNQRTPRANLPVLLLCLPLLSSCGLSQQQRSTIRTQAPCAASVATLEFVAIAVPVCDEDRTCVNAFELVRKIAKAKSESCEENP